MTNDSDTPVTSPQKLAERYLNSADVLRQNFGQSDGIKLTSMMAYATLLEQRISAKSAALQVAREAIQWVVNDAKYKAPEQFCDPEIVLRWIERLNAALADAAQAESKAGGRSP